jgi:hypothetical protein
LQSLVNWTKECDHIKRLITLTSDYITSRHIIGIPFLVAIVAIMSFDSKMSFKDELSCSIPFSVKQLVDIYIMLCTPFYWGKCGIKFCQLIFWLEYFICKHPKASFWNLIYFQCLSLIFNKTYFNIVMTNKKKLDMVENRFCNNTMNLGMNSKLGSCKKSYPF